MPFLPIFLNKRGLVFSTIRGFLVITFLFLILMSWKFAWLDLLGAYFEKWSRFVRTTTLPWVSTTWSPSLRRWWSSSWRNSGSGHSHSWPSIQSNASGNGPKWFLAPKNIKFDTKIKSVACSEVELLHMTLKITFDLNMFWGVILRDYYNPSIGGSFREVFLVVRIWISDH